MPPFSCSLFPSMFPLAPPGACSPVLFPFSPIQNFLGVGDGKYNSIG